MKQAVLVGIGGCLGAIARFKMGGIILHHSEQWRFPLSTFCVNVLGCFIFGLLAGAAERHSMFSADARLFLFTGLLGGFTTFSAFGGEGVNLLRRGEISIALTYAALSVACGLVAVWAGMKIFGLEPRVLG